MAAKQLNILHIDTEKYWRGGQQQVFYLHNSLIKKGIQSLLVCNESSELKTKCIEDNLPYFEQKMRNEIDIISAYKIAQLCKKEKINIIHAHSAHALSIGLLTKFFYSAAILIGVRRVDFPIKKNFFSQRKYNSSKIDKIVCISDFIKKVMVDDGIDEGKLFTIRSGTDIHKFDDIKPEPGFKGAIGIKSGQFIVGTVAAFAGHKDYPNLLKAFEIVKSHKGNINLCMIGDGPLFSEMKKLVKKMNIESDVIFTGFREDIGKFLKSFDIFVLASKKEGLGTSIIDALSVGLPIISTNTGGIPELISNNINGILVEPQNPDQLAEAILELYGDAEKRKFLSDGAIKSAGKFSINNTIQNNINLYQELLKK